MKSRGLRWLRCSIIAVTWSPIVAGISIEAHPDFRCAVTMNQDESTFEIPDYILSRLQPTLGLSFPIAKTNWRSCNITCLFVGEEMLNMTVEFLQQSHELKLDFSTRDGIQSVAVRDEAHVARVGTSSGDRPSLEGGAHPMPRRRSRGSQPTGSATRANLSEDRRCRLALATSFSQPTIHCILIGTTMTISMTSRFDL